MKKIILLLGVTAMLWSCSRDTVDSTTNTEVVNFQTRAPLVPAPEIIGDFNSGCVANVLILAEGFTPAQMGEFKILAARAKQAILDMEPFTTYTDRINFYRVDSPSEVSGINTQQFDSDCNGVTGTEDFDSTAWGVFGNRVGLQYYAAMKPKARELLEDLYGGYATDYAYTIIIVNTTDYYGGAEFPGVTQNNTIANPRVSNMIVSKYDSGDIFKFLVRHEFGHSFGNMDDEYVDALTFCAIKTYEPWYLPPTPKLNIRTSDPGGWYEGARYVPEDYWRQWNNSIMRNDYFATVFAPRQASVVKRRLARATYCP